MIDLTSSGKKTKPFQLYLDREIAFEVQAQAGIKVTPNRSFSSNTGYSYFITWGAARKLAKAYPDSVTYYGQELPANLREALS